MKLQITKINDQQPRIVEDDTDRDLFQLYAEMSDLQNPFIMIGGKIIQKTLIESIEEVE